MLAQTEVLMLLFFAICIEASLVLWCAGATAEPTAAGEGKTSSSLEEDAALKIVAGLNGGGWILTLHMGLVNPNIPTWVYS